MTISICGECGYSCRVDERDEHSNLRLQEDFFDADAYHPDKRYTRWPHRPALVASEVIRLAVRKGKALDIGCNTGMWLATLGPGWEKYGVELSEVAADIARKFTGAQIHNGPFESYHADPESFDLITAFAVIEHLSNPRMLVRWAFDHLKHGGIFVLMTGDRESVTAAKMGADWPLYHPEGHISFFSSRSICRLLEESKFRIERKEWRFMYTEKGNESLLYRYYMKLREVLKLVVVPIHDHFYVYARKP